MPWSRLVADCGLNPTPQLSGAGTPATVTPPQIPAARGFHLKLASPLSAVCSVYRIRNYGKPKQKCNFRHTGNRHSPPNSSSEGISPEARQPPKRCLFGLPHQELRETGKKLKSSFFCATPWSHSHRAQAAIQNKPSTKMVLKTAPPNAHQCSCLDFRGTRPALRRTASSTAAQLMPQGVPTSLVAL